MSNFKFKLKNKQTKTQNNMPHKEYSLRSHQAYFNQILDLLSTCVSRTFFLAFLRLNAKLIMLFEHFIRRVEYLDGFVDFFSYLIASLQCYEPNGLALKLRGTKSAFGCKNNGSGEKSTKW